MRRTLLLPLATLALAALPPPAGAASCSRTVTGQVSAFAIRTKNTGCTRGYQVARAYVRLSSCRGSCVAATFRCEGTALGETGDVAVRCVRGRRVVRFQLG